MATKTATVSVNNGSINSPLTFSSTDTTALPVAGDTVALGTNTVYIDANIMSGTTGLVLTTSGGGIAAGNGHILQKLTVGGQTLWLKGGQGEGLSMPYGATIRGGLGGLG